MILVQEFEILYLRKPLEPLIKGSLIWTHNPGWEGEQVTGRGPYFLLELITETTLPGVFISKKN